MSKRSLTSMALSGWGGLIVLLIALAVAHSTPVTCTFDGGGTITAGQTATTTDGTTWACLNTGALVKVVR